jgi:HD-GYP domain-containing protein (c-di-GMP phosphodiesterase class II)
LSGEAIPLISRIIAIVDSYDAMTQERAYSKSVSRADALKEIVSQAGIQFDPALVKAFVEIEG